MRKKLLSNTLILCAILSSAACFFPNNESANAISQKARKAAQLAGPLLDNMTVKVNDRVVSIRTNTSQDIGNNLRATLVVVPLAKELEDASELPCVAGFLRVENLGLTPIRIEPGTQVCYGNHLIESQLNDPNIRISTSNNQTCLNFKTVGDLAPKGESGDFASIVWYVCEAKS